jgi:hypothetical protein
VYIIRVSKTTINRRTIMSVSKISTAMGNSLEILKTETFVDNAEIVPKYGQGCNYETGKCVEGFQVDFDIKVSLKSGEFKQFHIVFQSLDRSDNLRAYSSSEMSTAAKYGCDADESVKLDNFTGYDEEIIEHLKNNAEKLCKEYFDNNQD